jgi:two-component system sensor histidine kinase AlgZ
MSSSLSASSRSKASSQRVDDKVRDLLPDFCSLPMTLGLVLYGELFAIVLALASPNRLSEFWVRLGPLSLFVLVIALLSATLLCVLRRVLRLLDGRISVALALALVVGSALSVGYATVWLLPWAESGGLLPDDGTGGLLIRAGLISAIVGAMMLRYLYLTDNGAHRWKRSPTRAFRRYRHVSARIFCSTA